MNLARVNRTTYGLVAIGEARDVRTFKPIVENTLASIGLKMIYWRLSKKKIRLVEDDKSQSDEGVVHNDTG